MLRRGERGFHTDRPEAVNPRQVLGRTMKRVQVALLKLTLATREPWD